MTSKINLTDKWARIHLARLCSALVYAEWTSTQTFVSGLGAPMWRMLVMLATRSLSCLQNCRVLQKALLCTAESRVKCSQLSLYVRESFCYQNGKILQRVLSSALSLSVFASDFFALEALCSCTAWQCDGCFGCDKQFMHWPSDKQLHAIKIKQNIAAVFLFHWQSSCSCSGSCTLCPILRHPSLLHVSMHCVSNADMKTSLK